MMLKSKKPRGEGTWLFTSRITAERFCIRKTCWKNPGTFQGFTLCALCWDPMRFEHWGCCHKSTPQGRMRGAFSVFASKNALRWRIHAKTGKTIYRRAAFFFPRHHFKVWTQSLIVRWSEAVNAGSVPQRERSTQFEVAQCHTNDRQLKDDHNKTFFRMNTYTTTSAHFILNK